MRLLPEATIVRENDKEKDMSNDDLQRWVTEELYWDPKVDDGAIAVRASDGEVTLRGTVDSFRQKRDAGRAAQRVYGVTSVKNELTVRPLNGFPREDNELRGDVLQALMLDSIVPTTIDARVDDGWVTLTGTASWKYQADEADFVAGNVSGVIGVDDQVELLNPQPSAHDVKDSIEKALKRDAKIDADDLTVDTNDGTVAVTGTVKSWSEHDAAIAAAWAAPGVKDVADHIVVAY
jgi:osmotically-inducible protein OsmY